MGSDLLSDVCREIEERLERLRPAVEEYERLRATAEAAGESEAKTPAPASKASATGSRVSRSRSAASAPAADGALSETILGVLEHGSHTPAELVVVTGVGAPQINRELRRLSRAGLLAKTQREGKLAWSLATAD